MNIIKSMRETVGIDYKRPDETKIDEYIEKLNNNEIAQDYLRNERGLSDESIKHFKLGYDEKRDAISIPIYKRGELINVKYRFLNPKKQKYSSEYGAETWIFNDEGIDLGLKKGGVLVVEGEFDLISAWQVGYKNVVSPAFGKDSFGVWIEQLDNIPKIYIAYDNDEGGKASALKMADRLGIDKSFEVCYPDEIKDANEFFKSYTKDDYRELLENAKPYYNYQFKGLGDIIESLRTPTKNTVTTKFFPKVTMEKDWLIVVSGKTNSGKCHAKGTKLLMSDGSIKNVEEIVIGDKLMGIESKPRTVLSLANGKEEMYRIHERNEYYDVNKSHILSLKKDSWDKKKKKTKIVDKEMSVEDFLKIKPETRRHYRGWKTSVDFDYQDIKLDPYFVGLWLGDGTSSKTQITTEDEYIKDFIYHYACVCDLDVTVREQKDNNSITMDMISPSRKKGSNYILNNLRYYNLLNNKHIPKEYKINDRQSRLEVLAGLIDTDGSLSKTERGEYFEIIQKNTQLSNDIVFLARSLGFRAKITKTKKSIKSINFTGEYNRIYITGDISLIPTRLDRKKSNFCCKKNWLTSKLDVEELGVGEYFGFTLDGDGLYLLDSFTVTHNTSYVLNVANDILDQDTPVLIMPFERGIDAVGKRFMNVRYDKTNEDFGFTNENEWDEIIQDCINKPLYFAVPKKDEIIDTIIKSKRLFDTKVVIVDHLDYLVRHVGGSREAEISNTLQNLKRIGEEHGIIIIIVTHIRKIEQAGAVLERKPNLDDLKGSSSLSQDPECVVLINKHDEGIEVNVAKNKGEMKSEVFSFRPETGKMGDSDFTDFTQELNNADDIEEDIVNQF